MADTIVEGASAWANLCLAWVDKQLNLPGWGGLSAAQAFQSFKGSAQTTTNPGAGDIVLYGGNNASNAGHAGIYLGAGNVASVLSDGNLHVTDLATLSGYEGGTSPIFVASNSLGSNVQHSAEAAVQTITAKLGQATGGLPPAQSFPGLPGPGQTTDSGGTVTTVGNPTYPPGLGAVKSPAAGTCQHPNNFVLFQVPAILPGQQPGPPSNVGDWIGFFFCVFSYWLARVGLAIAAGALILVGIWIYAQDKDAPGAQGLKAAGKNLPSPTLAGNVKKAARKASEPKEDETDPHPDAIGYRTSVVPEHTVKAHIRTTPIYKSRHAGAFY